MILSETEHSAILDICDRLCDIVEASIDERCDRDRCINDLQEDCGDLAILLSKIKAGLLS